MENWQDGLEQSIDEIIWSQWAALGAFVAAEPCRGSIIDPEALLVATCAFGRHDARIFDEAMDWTIANHGLLKPWRIKRISRSFGPDTQRALGAVIGYAALDTGRDLFPGVRKEALESLEEVETEELFRREKGRYEGGRGSPDEVFLEWKLLRGSPRIRHHSGKPDLGNPANLVLRLRDYYGATARADVMTYLFTNDGGSSNGIAERIKYRQSLVYGVLENLVGAGIAHKSGGRGHAYYWIDGDNMASWLGFEEERPAFFVWGDVFRVFDMVITDRREHPAAYESEFLAAERMRDLALEVIPLLRETGEPLSRMPAPDPGRLKGMEHGEALIMYMGDVTNVLRRYTVD
ncbi:MAG: hypothetical protein SWK76_04395 [Actinomycetota bacterium]|nr:hypothetical protein [Actinomycetota bacterium]